MLQRAAQREPRWKSSRGSRAEIIATLTQGQLANFTQQAISQFTFGQSVAFFKVFCGEMAATLGCPALGLCAPKGVDKLFPMHGVPWDLGKKEDQEGVTRSWMR